MLLLMPIPANKSLGGKEKLSGALPQTPGFNAQQTSGHVKKTARGYPWLYDRMVTCELLRLLPSRAVSFSQALINLPELEELMDMRLTVDSKNVDGSHSTTTLNYSSGGSGQDQVSPFMNEYFLHHSIHCVHLAS